MIYKPSSAFASFHDTVDTLDVCGILSLYPLAGGRDHSEE